MPPKTAFALARFDGDYYPGTPDSFVRGPIQYGDMRKAKPRFKRVTPMTDIVDKKTRSRWMAGIRGKDTKPEIRVRSYLHRAGFRFRLHKKGIPGRPDIWLAKHNAAIFVNGCYWHRHRGCRKSTSPKDNKAKWRDKFAATVVRDERNLALLAKHGIRVLVIWECELDAEKRLSKSLPKIAKWLRSKSRYREIPPPVDA